MYLSLIVAVDEKLPDEETRGRRNAIGESIDHLRSSGTTGSCPWRGTGACKRVILASVDGGMVHRSLNRGIVRSRGRPQSGFRIRRLPRILGQRCRDVKCIPRALSTRSTRRTRHGDAEAGNYRLSRRGIHRVACHSCVRAYAFRRARADFADPGIPARRN